LAAEADKLLGQGEDRTLPAPGQPSHRCTPLSHSLPLPRLARKAPTPGHGTKQPLPGSRAAPSDLPAARTVRAPGAVIAHGRSTLYRAGLRRRL